MSFSSTSPHWSITVLKDYCVIVDGECNFELLQNNDAKTALRFKKKKVHLRCLRRVEVCGEKSICDVTRECLIGETLNALIIRVERLWMPHLCVLKPKAYS